MLPLQEQFRRLLKKNRLSATHARLAVFEALVGQEPLSMHTLVEQVPDIDRASVYRAVELFERLGVVQRVTTGWKYKLELTDQFAEHHHHLSCTNCGRTIDIAGNELEQVIEQLSAAHHFKPLSHQIEIQGLCDRCV